MINRESLHVLSRLAAGLILFLTSSSGQIFERYADFVPQFRNERVEPSVFAGRDGSLWVTGIDFIDGERIEGLVRYRADGEREPTLRVTNPRTGKPITRPQHIVETDLGTILVGAQYFLRIDDLGNVDPGFTPPRLWTGSIDAVYPLPGNRLLVAGGNTYLRPDGSEFSRQAAMGLLSDGAMDPSFVDFAGEIKNVDPVGRIYVDRDKRLYRLGPDGHEDLSWTPLDMPRGIENVLLNPVGGIYVVAGRVGVSSNAIFRMDDQGNLDPGFNQSGEELGVLQFVPNWRFKVLDDGILLILEGKVFRLGPGGAVDESYLTPSELVSAFAFWGKRPLVTYLDPTKRPSFAGLLDSNGALDTSWAPGFGRNGILRAIQSDRRGRILVVGFFDYVDDQPRGGAVRLLPDGSIDPDFTFPLRPDSVSPSHQDSLQGYHDIRVGLDGSIFFKRVRGWNGVTTPPDSYWYRFDASGFVHPQQVPEVIGSHGVSASADGSLYFTKGYSRAPDPSDGPDTYGKTVFGANLFRIPAGQTDPMQVDIEFNETLVGPSAYIYVNFGSPDLEFLSDGQLLIQSGLQAAHGYGGVVTPDGASVTPFSVALTSSRFTSPPFYGSSSQERFGKSNVSTLVRIFQDGEVDPAFDSTWQSGHITLQTSDNQGRAIVLWTDETFATSQLIRLNADGSPEPGFRLSMNTEEWERVVGVDVASDDSIYVMRSKGGSDFLERYVPSTVPSVSIVSTDQSVVSGRDLAIYASANAEAGITWQWQHNGEVIPGETGPSLVRPHASLFDAGVYKAVAVFHGLEVSSEELKIEITPASSRIANFSARGWVGYGESNQIAGFVLSAPSSVLVRSIGPELSNFGVSGSLDDPEIVLHRGLNEIDRNRRWEDQPTIAETFVRLGAFPLTSQSSDAALHVDLDQGAYTAAISDDSGEGIGLVEIYLDDQSTRKPLRNFSVRAKSAQGDDQLIVGFVVSGDGPQPVLVRVIGSDLAKFGVTEVMTQPMLALMDSRGNELHFDEVEESTQAIADRVGAFALDQESGNVSAVVYLEAGSYTAAISGDTGVALFEIYAVNED